ncbi:MAG: hypothetical protein K2M95_07925 [Clostridiales bacterium]|nr:hypothetical protein [Clostridiales bacterium]
MGIESFYVNLRIDSADSDKIENIIKSNELYCSTLNWYFGNEEEKELSLQAATVSFYSMCEVIYKLCCDIAGVCKIERIETVNAQHAFDFDCMFDFMRWMYDCWKFKVDSFNKDWGIFSIKPSDYYKVRQKLRKKYFHTFE